MKSEATIMMHIIGNETDKEILEVANQIIDLSKHMDIKLNIVRAEPTKYTETAKSASTGADLSKYISLTRSVTNKCDDSLDAAIYGKYIVDQIKG